jgi:Protein of unknown function (DUF3810)
MENEKRQRRKNLIWIPVILIIALIKIFSLSAHRVETLYTSGFYSFFSRFLRLLTGWIPFSIGDVIYFLVACWQVWQLVKIIRLAIKKRLKARLLFNKFIHLVWYLLLVYIIFNIFWGLNYNRQGIAHQLNLTGGEYDINDVRLMEHLLLQKVNNAKLVLLNNHVDYPEKAVLFERAENCYRQTERTYPFLQYRKLSVKSSLYGWWGNYLGFTGYYNPFTGEAQVNTTVPKFLQPYIATHEMAHQLGYAKENAANFAGYLAAVNSSDTLFHYSAYFDLFLYANRELYYQDSITSRLYLDSLHPAVKQDVLELRRFNLAHRSFIEPAITWLYGNYLKLNEQPKGMRSYNEVIALLIAFYKQYGHI